ncbi:hypothetical protein CHL78_012235 [Romboutsia weinsteinii]|uniref:DUF5673 domain-containing protein n=1 Tax=Romboutsia weinsteinii TaxID=2020949 RepID=A0A371J1Z4_9FIRM|nr:hypothetical protein [Romboutsia weinsteinii]RDY26714.1 hypothetical protein CHL78_012235 [Romboutsia weinsteinii]
MKSKDIIKLVFILMAFCCMMFSDDAVIKIVSGVLLLGFIIVFRLHGYRERKNILSEIGNKKSTCMMYKEKDTVSILCPILFIANSVTTIKQLIDTKNMDILLNGEKEISSAIDFINRITFDEKVNIFTCIILIIIGVIAIVESRKSTASITDDKIVFYDGLIFEFSQITALKYKAPLFSINKNKIIKISQRSYEKEILVNTKDFESVKNHLESNVSI